MYISIFTTYTNPDLRNDPWKEALSCYGDFADEIIVTGENWPDEFSWELIGETFHEGFEKSSGDWAIRMDIDYFFHEKYIGYLRNTLKKYKDYPGVVFPQYQFFTPERFQLKARLCIALNKKCFPDIKLNAGGDLCLASLNGKILSVDKLPNVRIPVYQYDSMFRTKKIIADDRARFARAWERRFGEFGNRGSGNENDAYEAWFEEIKNKYKKHTNRLSIDNHPKYIKNKLSNLSMSQFGYDGFGLKHTTDRSLKDFIRGKKELYVDDVLINTFLKKNVFE